MYAVTEGLVKLAAQYNGVVFGGYVRDIIVPKIKLDVSLSSIDFSDMDFWFKHQVDADNFIKAAQMKSRGVTESSDKLYPIKRQNCWSFYKNRKFCLVDVMVSSFYPVCDFLLIYYRGIAKLYQ